MMKTATGFEFELDTTVLDNMELIEALAALDENPVAIPRVLNLILGPEQKQKLYDFVRDDSGRVSAARVAQELAEIFKTANDHVKKS